MDKLPHKNTRRFESSRLASYKSADWAKRLECQSVGDRVNRSTKRCFVIISPPTRTRVEGKAARQILLFDHHPESLRLAFNIARQFAAEEIISRRREKLNSSICASILLAVLAALMLSPLWT